jgi:hypothetical protein
MSEPRRLTNLWAFTACYKNSVAFLPWKELAVDEERSGVEKTIKSLPG